MIRINDIKDDELRELAYKRTLEENGKWYLGYVKQTNKELGECFIFFKTPEDHSFWREVSEGKITKIP